MKLQLGVWVIEKADVTSAAVPITYILSEIGLAIYNAVIVHFMVTVKE